MVQYIPSRNTWSEIGEKFAGGATEGYLNRSDENALKKSVEGLGPNASPRQILDAITNTKTSNPEAKQRMLKNYMGVAEFENLQKKAKEQSEIQNAELDIKKAKEAREVGAVKEKATKEAQDRAATKSIVNQLNLPDEQKNALGESLSKDAAEHLFKEQMKPTKEAEKKLTTFEKKIQEKHAEDYIKLMDEIPKLETTLENIKYSRKLSQDIGNKGVVASALGLSGKAKELESVSFTLMEPIVKIFNPSGPIAQQKLKTIQDKYTINGSDAPWTKKAKLDALERFAKQAQKRAQEKLALIEKYEGVPPREVLERFDKESDTISDAMVDYNLQGEEVEIPGMPPAAQYKGEEVEGAGGEVYFSDGERWIKR